MLWICGPPAPWLHLLPLLYDGLNSAMPNWAKIELISGFIYAVFDKDKYKSTKNKRDNWGFIEFAANAQMIYEANKICVTVATKTVASYNGLFVWYLSGKQSSNHCHTLPIEKSLRHSG